jgi:hypothetical protein
MKFYVLALVVLVALFGCKDNSPVEFSINDIKYKEGSNVLGTYYQFVGQLVTKDKRLEGRTVIVSIFVRFENGTERTSEAMVRDGIGMFEIRSDNDKIVEWRTNGFIEIFPAKLNVNI